MKRTPAIIGTLIALLAANLPAQDASRGKPESEPPVIGVGRKHTIPSRVLGEKVDLIVHLPGDYASGEKRYPVLLFLGSDARSKFAQAAATLDCMTDGGQLPGIILVGVDLPHGNSVLVPQEKADGAASADRHIAVLAEEIIPFVDRTFRTNEYRILYGASNGGIFAVYALLSGKLPVQAYFASSPMLGWCPSLISEKAKAAFADPSRSGAFLFLLGSDDDYGHVTRELPKFVALLEKNAPAWLRWKSETRHNEGHVPEMDLPLGLRALFPDFNPETELMTLRALREHFTALSKRYGFEIDVPEARIFDVGFELANGGQLDEAQRIFEFCVEHYPRNALMRTCLGFVHKQRGNSEVAIGHLKKALEIDPEQGWAKQQLAELQQPK
jgi:predicted alpha/beta superfamily hydrolase